MRGRGGVSRQGRLQGGRGEKTTTQDDEEI